MSKVKVKAVRYACDGCGQTFLVDEDDEQPYGYHGNVFWIGNHGGSGGEWFAHDVGCIEKAVMNAAAS